MSIKYKIFPKRKLVYAVGKGPIQFDDLMAHIDEIACNPEYTPPMKKIVDYRNATIEKLSSDQANQFTEKKSQLKSKFKDETCVLVTETDLNFGMSRMHGTHIETSNIKTNVFRNIEDALSWLQVNLDESEMELGWVFPKK
jgi:hypothetical protein